MNEDLPALSATELLRTESTFQCIENIDSLLLGVPR